MGGPLGDLVGEGTNALLGFGCQGDGVLSVGTQILNHIGASRPKGPLLLKGRNKTC